MTLVFSDDFGNYPKVYGAFYPSLKTKVNFCYRFLLSFPRVRVFLSEGLYRCSNSKVKQMTFISLILGKVNDTFKNRKLNLEKHKNKKKTV